MKKIESFFDSKAKNYDAEISEYSDYLPAISKIKKLTNVKYDQTIIDIGTGTGRLIKKFIGKTNRLIAIDISKKMLKRAKYRKYINVSFIRADMRFLPLMSGTTDISVSNLVFHHLKNIEKTLALREIHRILKPHGKIIIGDSIKTKKGYKKIAKILINKYMHKHSKIVSLFFFTRRVLDLILLNREWPASPNEWKNILSSSGFKKIKIYDPENFFGIISAIKHN